MVKKVFTGVVIFFMALGFNQGLFGMGDFFGKYFPKYQKRGPIFHYTIRLPNPNVPELEIELEAFGLRSGKQQLVLLGNFSKTEDVSKKIKDVVARNAFGNRIGVEWAGIAQEPGLGGVFLWETSVPFDRFLRLNYKVSLPKEPLGPSTQSFIRSVRARLIGSDIFIFPMRARYKSRFLVEFRLPKAWDIYTTLPKVESAYALSDLSDLLRSAIGVGKYVKYEKKKDTLKFDMIFGADKEAPELKNATESIFSTLNAQVAIFGGYPAGGDNWHMQVICNFDPVLVNRGVINSNRKDEMVLLMPSAQNLNETLSDIAGETFRFWNPQAIRPAEGAGGGPEAAWLSEGANEYYARKSRLLAGIIDKNRFEQVMKENYNKYVQNKLRLSLALPEAYVKRVQDPEAVALLYCKGTLTAYMLDVKIAKDTKGKNSLDDVMKKLYMDCNYFKGGQPYTNDTVIQIINTLTGADYEPFFKDYILGTKEIAETDVFPLDKP
ncbi:MAG: hypothetical protein ABIH01_01385 [Candidatus Omnitrophota bacterium]